MTSIQRRWAKKRKGSEREGKGKSGGSQVSDQYPKITNKEWYVLRISEWMALKLIKKNLKSAFSNEIAMGRRDFWSEIHEKRERNQRWKDVLVCVLIIPFQWHHQRDFHRDRDMEECDIRVGFWLDSNASPSVIRHKYPEIVFYSVPPLNAISVKRWWRT